MNINVEEQVVENMKDIVVKTAEEFGKPVTYVAVTMKNGFTLREAVASDPEDYNEEADKARCLRHIRDKIRLVFQYDLQERLFKQKKEQKNAHKKFKPFQKVLVKVTHDDGNQIWVPAIYSYYNDSRGRHHFTSMQWTDDDSSVIPFEGNEDKVGKIAE